MAWLWLTFIMCVGLLGPWAREARAQAADAVCAEVKIVIEQKFSMERQAFDAKMVVTNGLADQKLENVSIELQFLDANNNVVVATVDPNAQGATFFYRTDEVTGISSLNGGTIEAKAVANINWLIIPAAGSGGRNPEGAVYYVGAKVTYTLAGKTDTVNVTPEAIVVRPQPELVLDYFLPRDVYADDPFTPETEVAEPFTLGVRIKNQGGGTSYNTKIDTAQPKIVENRQGLAINFQILGGYVADQQAGKSLLLDFGDIESGASKMGRWSMVTSLAGRFVEFNASFTHADSLGGAVTSLIKEVRAHTLIHDVRVDLPGRDKLRDFLAKDGDTYRVYESDGVDTVVQNQTASAQMSVQGNNASLKFNAVTQGFAYARVSDPSRGAKLPVQVTRSDGYIVPAENVWLSKERNEDLSWSYFLNVFDANTTGQYTIGFVAGSAQSSIAGVVYKDANANGLREGSEAGIPVTEIKLTGTQTGTGASELQTAHTNAQGQFSFINLKPGVYTLVAGVADGLVDGVSLVGSAGGTSEAGKFSSVELTAGTAAVGYLFSKRTAKPATTDPELKADLKVALGATPASVKRGDKSTMTVTAANLGPSTAKTVSVNVELPAGLAVQTHSAAVGSYASGVWTLGDMAASSVATLTIEVQTPSDGVAKDFAVSARIGSSTQDDITSNNSASTLLSIQAGETVTATQTVNQGIRILAYVGCGADATCAEQKRQTAQTALSVYDANVEVVTEAAAFQKSLRAGDFSILWLNGSLPDLSESLQEEVRAAVVRGASLVVGGAADTNLRSLADIWGSYADQPLASAALQINADQVPLTHSSWALDLSVGANAQLHYVSGQVAAARAAYGKGQVLVLGFDQFANSLSGTAWTGWLNAQMALSTPHLSAPMLVKSIAHVQTVVTSGDTKSRQLTLTTSALSSGAKLVSARPAATQTGDPLTWPLDIAAGAALTVDLWLELPADSKAFALESQLRNSADSSTLDSWSHSVRTIASDQAQANARSAMTAVPGLTDAQHQAMMSQLDAATAAVAQQKYGDAIGSLTQAHRSLRALPQAAARDLALQSIAQWIGLVSASWKSDDSATKNWTLTISSGNNQSTRVGTVFGAALQVRLADENNLPVAGQTVKFIAPASGASAAFGNGLTQLRATTDAQGIATSGTLQAGATTGAYQVVASIEGVTTTAVFDLDNLDAGTPVLTLQAVSGSGQSANVGQAFANILRVKLADSQGAGIAGRVITFTLPSNGASASFAGGAFQYQVQTDANGFANSASLLANNVEGPFVAVATAAGAPGPVQFALTNSAATAPVLNLQTVSGGGQSATIGGAFANAIRMKLVNAQGTPVAGHSMTFTFPAQGASASFAGGARSAQAVTDAQGLATSPQFTANQVVGDFEMVVVTTGASEVRVPLKNAAASAGDKQVTITTPTGTGTFKATVAGGGASCRFDLNKTSVKKPEGVLPLLQVLIFPHGVFDYELIGCDVGSTVTVTTEWPNLFGISNYLKYGPTPTSRGKSIWYPPRNLKLQGNKVSYTITDGQLGDDDLTANGVIKDPGGPVIQNGPLPGDAISVPGLTPVATALLSLLMLLAWGGYQYFQPSKRRMASRRVLARRFHGE